MYDRIEVPQPPFFIINNGSILMGEFADRKSAEKFAIENKIHIAGWNFSIYTLQDIINVFKREDYFNSEQFVTNMSPH